jgi:hypothetical protein
MDQAYVETVRLLLETAPEVFRPACFAMKGGTALNLFVQDMPRLSIDIDVVYVSHPTARTAALAEIRDELNALEGRLRAMGLDAKVSASKVGDETKVFVARKNRQIKIEVNHVFRGTVLPTERRKLAKAASDLFTTVLTVPTLAVAELYGSKLVAALDRQHPRDLFDVDCMYRKPGLSPEIVECFVCYLAGHNRPVHEVLFSRDLDLKAPFEREFQGMTIATTSLAELQAARERLRRELPAALTDSHKQFLLGLVAGEPPWDTMTCRHLAALPAIQWKLANLARLKKANPGKFRQQKDALKKCFET